MRRAAAGTSGELPVHRPRDPKRGSLKSQIIGWPPRGKNAIFLLIGILAIAGSVAIGSMRGGGNDVAEPLVQLEASSVHANKEEISVIQKVPAIVTRPPPRGKQSLSHSERGNKIDLGALGKSNGETVPRSVKREEEAKSKASTSVDRERLNTGAEWPPRVGCWLPEEVRHIEALSWVNTPRGGFRSTPYLPLTDEHVRGITPEFAVAGDPEYLLLPGMAVTEKIRSVTEKLRAANHSKLAVMFEKTFPNTLSTTVSMLKGGGSYVITGDIDLMWLRDSSAQVHQYLSLHADPTVRAVIEGLVQQQMFFIPYSPYGSSFRVALRKEDDLGAFHVGKARNVYTSMHNYELDSLCYPIWISHQWWRASGRSQIFTARWREVAWLIVDLFQREQRHYVDGDVTANCSEAPGELPRSCYRYTELPDHRGSRVAYTGMIWSGFRPSDDQTKFGYLVPSNMFAVVALGQLIDIARDIYHDYDLVRAAEKLRREVDDGIHKHAVVRGPGEIGDMYAFEVNGFGQSNLMDDANVPSLISIPYLGYESPYGRDKDGQIAANTRKFVLSSHNPEFHAGTFAEGIGSPHTGTGTVWPMSIIMRGLTSNVDSEIDQVFKHLQATDAGTNLIHESFNPNNPSVFSRTWFAWANSLFSELVIKHLDWLVLHPQIPDPAPTV